MADAWIDRIAGAISARTPLEPPRLLGSRPAKVLGGLAALLVLAGLVAGLALLPAGDVWAQDTRTALDADGDKLIEVENLEQLNAIRWDLNGDGDPDDDSNNGSYNTAFFTNAAGSTCSGCTGYELTADLDFDTGTAGDRTDDTYWNGGAGWTPIGFFSNPPGTNHPYTATFDGKGHTISNLFIDQDTSTGADDPDNRGFGLFATTANGSEIRGVGLLDVSVTGRANTGSLIGRAEGDVYATYATGSVTGAGTVGGLIAHTRSTAIVAGSWADVDVTAESNMGGLVGLHVGGDIIASYATGAVHCDSDCTGPRGGLVGSHREAPAGVVASYSTGTVTPTAGGDVGGLIGNIRNGGTAGSVTNSYWDNQTSGLTASAAGTGQTTSVLQSPLQTDGYTGIYANWNVDLDGDSTNDDPWHFGTDSQYPALKVDFNGDGVASGALELGPQRPPVAVVITARLLGDILAIRWEIGEGNSAPTGYQYRYNTDGTTWNPDWTYTTDVSIQSFTISNPPSDATYNIEVRAVNDHADSPGTVDTYQAVVAILQGTTDYDTDDDGLIEITNLEQLNAIRYDPDGNGTPASGSETEYAVAFSDHVTGMGCPGVCEGYELFDNHSSQTDSDVYSAGDLDFDDTGSYASGDVNTAWTGGSGWEPIGDAANPFTARFYGNGYGIRNLFINRPTTDNVGLFGSIGAGGSVAQFALKEVNVTGQDNVGGLAGQNDGDVRFTYVTGRVDRTATTWAARWATTRPTPKSAWCGPAWTSTPPATMPAAWPAGTPAASPPPTPSAR